MSTPDRRKALKALVKRKRLNKERIARGLDPIMADKKTKMKKRVSLSTFRRRTGGGAKSSNPTPSSTPERITNRVDAFIGRNK